MSVCIITLFFCFYSLGWQWVEYRKARHPMFWVCDEGCKSGCGAELASYSHCNLHGNGAHSNGAAATNGHSVTESKFKYEIH